MSADHGNVVPAPVSAGGDRPLRRGWLWLASLAAAYLTAFAFYPRLFFAIGVNHYDAWFLDTFALLASNDAVSRGLDPYAPNPLDYFHRPHVYSHWWLHLRDFGLTRADVMWLGLTLAVAFLAAALWRLRPHTLRQLLWYGAVLCSSPVLLALDRGNNDLVIFVLLTPVVPCLLSGRPAWRLVAPFLVTAAAMLKYYPAAAALVLLAAPDARELRSRLVITLLLLTFAGLSVAGDLADFGALAPRPEGLMSFGATSFFNELGWTGWAPKLLCVGAGLAAAAYCWNRRPLQDWAPTPAQRADWLHFVLGAALLAGCFFTSRNFAYRLIFSVWLAPLLWLLARDAASPPRIRRLARGTMGLLLIALWWGPIGSAILFRLIGAVGHATLMLLAKWIFLVEQPFDWALFLCLLVFLTHFARGGLDPLRRGQN